MKIRIEEVECEKDEAEIHEKLREFNRSKREASAEIPLDIFYEDDNGTKQAGLISETFGNWLCIKYLFVSEAFRNKGIGKKIMQTAEETARNRGCKYVFVDTFNFQAPEFYKALGFQEVFRLKNYPYNGSRYYYTKTL
jgi:GNAT superfamily N-acetyltransferase